MKRPIPQLLLMLALLASSLISHSRAGTLREWNEGPREPARFGMLDDNKNANILDLITALPIFRYEYQGKVGIEYSRVGNIVTIEKLDQTLTVYEAARWNAPFQIYGASNVEVYENGTRLVATLVPTESGAYLWNTTIDKLVGGICRPRLSVANPVFKMNVQIIANPNEAWGGGHHSWTFSLPAAPAPAPPLPSQNLTTAPIPAPYVRPAYDDSTYNYRTVDQTIPDNTVFSPGQEFRKIWRIINNGQGTWGSGYSFAFYGRGLSMGGQPIIVPNVSTGQSWEPAIAMRAPSVPGTYVGWWSLRDPSGRPFGEPVYVQIIVAAPDTTPPVTSLSINPEAPDGSHGWYRSIVTISLNASDNSGGSGVARTEYRVNGGSWETVTGPIPLLEEGQGVLVEFRSLDNAGNWEAIKTLRLDIDRTPPLTTAALEGTQGKQNWFRSDVVVTLSASDKLSGVEKTEYRVNGADWRRYNDAFTISTERADNLVEYRSYDVAGNAEETHSQTIKIDKTPPVTSGSATGPRDSNGLFRNDLSINLSVTDNLSGKDFSQYTNKAGEWVSLQPQEKGFVLTGNGVSRFQYRSQDIAGNVEVAKDSGPIIINKYVLFSNGSNQSLQINKNTNVAIGGDMHSNGSASIRYNTVFSAAGGSLTTVSSGNQLIAASGRPLGAPELPLVTTGVQPVPMLSYPLALYAGMADLTFPTTLYLDATEQVLSGIIYVNGDIIMRATKLTGTVSLISTGSILDETTTQTMLTADPFNGMLRYAGKDITLRTTTQAGLGLMYAPNGTIHVGSTKLDLNGSLVANEIDITAATDFKVRYSAAFQDSTYPLPLPPMALNPTPSPTPKPAVPVAPVLVGPLNKLGTSLTPLLMWNAAPEAVGYEVQIATSPEFSVGTLKGDISCLSTAFAFTLAKATKYYWRVRGVNRGGLGSWSSPGSFTTTDPTAVPPKISDFTPASATAGTVITIIGSGLGSVNSVLINGTTASFVVDSDTQIKAIVPTEALTGPIKVTSPLATATSSGSLKVLPSITSFTPVSGEVGVPVVINGSGFTTGTSVTVKFNGTATTGVPNATPTQIKVQVPRAATSGKISVTTPYGTVISNSSFMMAPQVNSFTPSSGIVGTVLILTGSNFSEATDVRLNGKSVGPVVPNITTATSGFQIVSSTQIKLKIPSDATTGSIAVTSAAGTGSARGSFRVTLK